MIYEYECRFCGERSDLTRSVGERDLVKTTPCPKCSKVGGLIRQMSNPAIRFDGAGFTRTPAIMRDPIAANSPMQGTNWGNTSSADIGRRTGQSTDDE